MPELFRQVETALLESEPALKCTAVARIRETWGQGGYSLAPETAILPIDDPGRPDLPELVDPRKLQRRSFASAEGRLKMLHAFAHIEFNAINIALDAVYRFRGMPAAFVDDCLKFADE